MTLSIFPDDTTSSSNRGKIMTGTGNRGNGSRGPIAPKPGVFRPCARCRSKKTKCDRLKPTCSSCIKSGGSNIVCIYDNDEPTLDVSTSSQDELDGIEEGLRLQSLSPLTIPDAVKPKQTKQPSISTTAKRDTNTAKGQSTSSKPQPKTTIATTEPIAVSISREKAPKTQNSNRNSNTSDSSNDNSNKIGTNSIANSKKSISPSDLVSNSPDIPTPPVKKMKTGSTSSTTIKPSPLRTSITTSQDNLLSSTPPSKLSSKISGTLSGTKKRTASVSNGTSSSAQLESRSSIGSKDNQHGSKQNNEGENETDEVGSIDSRGGDDIVVSQLSVKESGQDQEISARSEKRESGPRQHRTMSSWNNTTTSPASPNSKSSSNSQGKIMVELSSSRQQTQSSQPAFVIDTSKRARKWGRSGIAFQTLGGVVSIPLWTSDQDMLLNEPKPLYIQQPIPMMTSGRKDSSLARLAVLSQLDLDMDMDVDSPERGNTPDSIDGGSPGPTPSIKKKRGSRKPQLDLKDENLAQSNGANKLSSTKKNLVSKRIRTDSGNSTAVDDIDGMDGEEDHISIPKASAPTQQRPRTFPCSFEGCTKSFMDKFHLDRHEARHVTDEIVCGIDGCTKAYNSISTVRRHQSMMHKDKKLQMDAAASSIEVETEGEMEGNNTKNKQAGTKKNIEKKGKSKTSSANITPVEPIKMSLILKDVKDSAYRPWMDNPTEPIIRTPSSIKDTK